MSFREAQLSLQLLAEERVGAKARRAILEAKEREDAAAAAQAAQLSGMTGGTSGNR